MARQFDPPDPVAFRNPWRSARSQGFCFSTASAITVLTPAGWFFRIGVDRGTADADPHYADKRRGFVLPWLPALSETLADCSPAGVFALGSRNARPKSKLLFGLHGSFRAGPAMRAAVSGFDTGVLRGLHQVDVQEIELPGTNFRNSRGRTLKVALVHGALSPCCLTGGSHSSSLGHRGLAKSYCRWW